MAVIDKRKANTAKSMQVNMGGDLPEGASPKASDTTYDPSQRKEPAHMLDQPADDGQDQSAAPVPIEQDPEAMQCVDLLKQKGYTADDVERAMGGGEMQEEQQPGDSGDTGGY